MFKCCKKKEDKKNKKKYNDDDEMQEETASKKDNIFAFTKKGYGKKKTECQDTHIILEKIGGANMTYLAVYDGHGANGRLASKLANNAVQTMLEECAAKIQKIKNTYTSNYTFDPTYMQKVMPSLVFQ